MTIFSLIAKFMDDYACESCRFTTKYHLGLCAECYERYQQMQKECYKRIREQEAEEKQEEVIDEN